MSASDQQDEVARANYAKVVAKAWADASFKAKLMDDPHSALEEAGYAIPQGVSVKVVENTTDTVHLILPAAPSAGELSEDALDKVAAGASCIDPSYCFQGRGR